MKPLKIVVGVLFSIAFIVISSTQAQARPWYEHYIAHTYKVRVKKPVVAHKLKFGKQVTYAKTFKLHKGEVVTTSFAGAGNFNWPIHSKKYKSSRHYAYDAKFTKGSFKLLKTIK